MGNGRVANKVSQPSGAHDLTYLGYITTGVGWGARIVQYDTILYDMTLTREHDTRTRLLGVYVNMLHLSLSLSLLHSATSGIGHQALGIGHCGYTYIYIERQRDREDAFIWDR